MRDELARFKSHTSCLLTRHGSSAAPRYREIGRRFDPGDTTYSAERIVDAWLHDQAIRLTSRCHGARWDSTDVERNQIFEYAEAIYATTGKSHFGQS
jgi:hypothetical protein